MEGEDRKRGDYSPQGLPLLPYPSRNRAVITAGVMLGLFLSALESTAVMTAMPTVIASLGGLSIYNWVFSAYLLTSTITLPLWGKLSDQYGRRNIYLIGVSIFLIGSALSGLSHSMVQLILFRLIQGLGAGCLLPLAMTVVGEIYTLDERGKMQGLLSGVWGLSSLIGPFIGGLLTDYLSWRWVFYLNIPFGLLSAMVIGVYLKPGQKEKKTVFFDHAGGVSLAVALTLFLLILMRLGKGDSLFSPLILLMLFGFLFLMALFFHNESRVSDPVLPLQLFTRRVFASASLNGFLGGMAMFGSIAFIPLFVQAVLNTSATKAGSVLTPFVLTWMVFSIVGGHLLLRVGIRFIVFIGMASLTLGFFLLSRMNLHTVITDVMRNMVFLGAGMGFSVAPLTIAVQNTVPRSQLGIATSMTQFFRTIGGTLGVTLLGTVLSRNLQAQFHQSGMDPGFFSRLNSSSSASQLIVSPQVQQTLSPDTPHFLKLALFHSLHSVFVAGLWIALLAFVSAILLPRENVRKLTSVSDSNFPSHG